MDAKNTSGEKFTLKYYSLSISPWGSPEITADGEQNMPRNHFMFALSLYSPLEILCWPLSGEEYWTRGIFNQIQWLLILHYSLLIGEARIILASTHLKHIQTDNNPTFNCLFFTNNYLEGFKHIASVSTCSLFKSKNMSRAKDWLLQWSPILCWASHK